MMRTFITWLQSFKQKRAINDFDLLIFFQQFATLIGAGIPILQCCDILEKSQEKIRLRLLIFTLKRELNNGKNLCYSMRIHPHYFDEFTCQLIDIGEQTGKLETILRYIATRKEKQLALKRTIQQLLFYPSLLIAISILVIGAMFLYVIPQFNLLFVDMREQLPFITLCLFYLSDQLQQYIGWISLLILSLLLLCYYQQTNLKQYLQQGVMKVPFVNEAFQKLALAHFSRNLALAFAAGIPILEALNLIVNATGEKKLQALFINLISYLNIGKTLHQSMALLSFPTLMIQMVKIGEESGTLEPMLIKNAEFLESDFTQFIAQLTKGLEPLIMLILGVLIGGLVIAMYLPIFKLGSTF